MLIALLQTSLLVKPMYIADEPPPLRSARNITLYVAGGELAPPSTTRSREEALATAEDLAERLRAGVDFRTLARERSEAPNAASGAVLGAFAQGMLAPELDRFLFAAAEGEISGPIATAGAVHLLQRVETYAAVLQIQASSAGQGSEAHAAARRRAETWIATLREGGDFAELARKESADEASAKRGGQFAIYERSGRDTMLKAAAFELAIGEVAGPFESPLGWHVLKRVRVEDVDPRLAEANFMRLRAILVQHDQAMGADPVLAPTAIDAKKIADGLVRRLEGGEDMGKVAREFNDDPGGKERGGDLGWIHRATPELPQVLRGAFYMRPGERTGALSTPYGWVILRRDK